jgi:hypothetical protein
VATPPSVLDVHEVIGESDEEYGLSFDSQLSLEEPEKEVEVFAE